jgi:N-acetylneuraminic acid mutarotase
MKPSYRFSFLRIAILVMLPCILVGCGTSYTAPPNPTTYTIGGMVSGLTGTGLVLQDNGGNNLTITANGAFTFTTAVASGGAYAVTVLTQPSSPAQNCVVTSGSGTASANVTNVQVTCTTVTVTFTIGGAVTNLVGTGLVLQDNGGDNLTITVNGNFTFPTSVASGGAYAVTVLTQPSTPAQICSVTNGSGTANANVTNVTVNCGHNEWAWMSGANDTTPNQNGTYGTQGTAAPANVPGVRNVGPVSWTDASGNLWLFGGNGLDSAGTNGGGDLNDLWKYNITSNEWTWVNGSNLISQQGNYGTQGAPALTNVPGARDSAVSWTDASGNLWLFGGNAIDSAAATGLINDLWEFNITSNKWAWVSGSKLISQQGTYGTQGTPALANIPGARQHAVTWTDTSGNLWLFGGSGLDSAGATGDLNDLWKYNITSNEWTWVSGSKLVSQKGTYGTLGTAALANVPGARDSAVSWKDTSGNLWVFGGSGLDSAGTSGELSDLWKFTITSGEWTWMNGPNIVNQIGTYGTQGTPALANVPGGRSDLFSWTDPSGNFWLFGGFGYDSTNPATGLGNLNDLWKYTVSSGEWTWMNGPNIVNQNGVYGTQGILAPGNVPGNREGGASWTDASGNLWLFAGSGTLSVNDLWMYFP